MNSATAPARIPSAARTVTVCGFWRRLAAGLIDAIAGGGGLLTVPALLTAALWLYIFYRGV